MNEDDVWVELVTDERAYGWSAVALASDVPPLVVLDEDQDSMVVLVGLDVLRSAVVAWEPCTACRVVLGGQAAQDLYEMLLAGEMVDEPPFVIAVDSDGTVHGAQRAHVHRPGPVVLIHLP